MQNFYLLLRNCLLKFVILDVIVLWNMKLSPMIRGKSLTVKKLPFWLIVFFFRKNVPTKGLDPVSQALLSSYLCNFAITDPGTQILSLLKLKQVVRVGQDFLLIIIKNLLTSFLVKYSFWYVFYVSRISLSKSQNFTSFLFTSMHYFE